jgi:hypothetical protein
VKQYDEEVSDVELLLVHHSLSEVNLLKDRTMKAIGIKKNINSRKTFTRSRAISKFFRIFVCNSTARLSIDYIHINKHS